MTFQAELINWYQNNKRDLPWRHTNDAYTIWLSEIILQQTRVEQGLPYFNKFLENFPTVSDFASATETKVLKLWQGLGYYSRGRNMHATAQAVVNHYNGIFPVNHDELIKLKGIGEYTAAAISSFSSGEARAVVDGNVFRVLARYFGISTPINSPVGKKEFYKLANELLDQDDPATYNQSIMEFGAIQCKPKSPNCSICPLNQTCYAFMHQQVNLLPVKIRKAAQKHRYMNYFICENEQGVLVRERQAGDIWQHLFDFPSIEALEEVTLNSASFAQKVSDTFGKEAQFTLLASKKHILTHQIIHLHFFSLKNYIFNFSKQKELKWVSLIELDELPQPKVIHDFITDYLL
ncbi:A/G-specific DNA-adenine glycosylase [Pedobacter psychrotolerans]|uniref:Adenine DNA glycosylase n=1 Tax=Pedobacter psychrotolerans TaxID=1843235 RepID=A0A4R2HAR3_9SPHI|nr:A/G-specific adenine glycosylase [Pedobacter psychrotolerans]TCO23905.1 A/G-specific DNA-adenine glycosylase [Pedobacter psychrotolerans]GGE63490.1 A/G-specific adenine glycosylase [Pedobacter psychrotolerans]